MRWTLPNTASMRQNSSFRERLNKNKVALDSQFRGLLSEFGVVFPCDHTALLTGLSSVIDNTQSSQRLQYRVKDMLSE